MAEKILLKKYANRRLYDTEQSKYVTLSQVADRIRSGSQVTVIDAKTKEDVTAAILLQIILEASRSKTALLPVPLLELIIRYGDNVLAEFFENYLQQTIGSYLAYKQSADEQFKKWLEMGMDMTQKGFERINPLQAMFASFAGRTDSGKDKDKSKP